ncbi:MAG: hypothetical protein AAB467_04515 [Patescibacteria group bacterium]
MITRQTAGCVALLAVISSCADSQTKQKGTVRSEVSVPLTAEQPRQRDERARSRYDNENIAFIVAATESLETNRRLNYAAQNAIGASGFTQIMPDNIPEWSRQCLGREISVAEFRASSTWQKLITSCKEGRYWDQYHNACAVLACWHSGKPNYLSKGGDGSITTEEYVRKTILFLRDKRPELVKCLEIKPPTEACSVK